MTRDNDPAVLAVDQGASRAAAAIIIGLRGRQGGGGRGPARRPAGDDALVIGRTCGRLIPPSARAEPAAGGRPRRRDDDGITASIPMMLTLIEAIAGGTRRGQRRATSASRNGTASRQRRVQAHASVRHDGSGQHAGLLEARERLGIALAPGIDEVSLALVADAWSRTYRSLVSCRSRAALIRCLEDPRRHPAPARSGRADLAAASRLLSPANRWPAQALDETLGAIAQQKRYGAGTADVVATQLEYPRHQAAQ